MKNRFLKIVTAIVCMCLALCIGAFAAENRVYVSGSASAGNGSESSPFNTFAAAVNSLGKNGGEIVLLGDTQLGGMTIPEQSENLVITSEGGRIILSADLTFEKNTNGNLIKIDAPISVTSASAAILGGFNSIRFTENCSVSGTLDFYGGADSGKNPSSSTKEGMQNLISNRAVVTEIAYDITVDGGTFRYFAGGSRRPDRTSVIGSVAAPLTVTVNGGTFGKAVKFTADSAIKNEQAFSLSGMSLLASDATLVINGGIFNSPIYAQGYLGELCVNASAGSQLTKSDAKYYALDGNISITVNGGKINGCEINAFQNCAGYSQLLRGNYTLTVSDKAQLASGIVFDATQVKAYKGSTNKATLVYPDNSNAEYKRFDVVNEVAKTYEEPLRIACIGDSITQGYGTTASSETESYPAQLLTYLSGEGASRVDGRDVILGNYGCSSTRVMDYSGQWYQDMLAYTISSKEADADIVIIGLGTNDSGYVSVNVGQHEHFKTDYTALLSAYGECDDTDKIFGTTAIYRHHAYDLSGYIGCIYDLGAINVRSLQKAVIEELSAKDKRYACIDLYALTLEDALSGKLLSSDDLHPATSGYKIYMQRVADAWLNGEYTVDGFELKDIYVSANGKNVSACSSDNPTNNLAIAFARAGDGSTLHVSGRVDAAVPGDMYCWFTPMVASFKIVGETDDAAIVTNGKLIQVSGDLEVDNVEFSTTAANSIMIQLGYNNVTLGKGFKTLPGNIPALVCGYVSFSGGIKDTYYTTPEFMSSNNDCVININGGTYSCIFGGNYLYYNTSLLGTYSGDMTVNIGKDASVAYDYRSSAAGMNYVTGSVTFNVGAWADGESVPTYALRTDTPVYHYEPANNTGKVCVNVLDGVNATAEVMGDLDGDGEEGLTDILRMCKYLLEGNFDMSAKYFGRSKIRLIDVAAALARLSK